MSYYFVLLNAKQKNTIMKTLLPFLSLAFSFFFLLACSSGKDERAYVIGVSQCSLSDEWRQAMVSDMEVEVLDHPGMRLEVADAGYDSDTQVRQIRDFIKRKVDLLIISSNEMDPVTPAAVEAYRSGIPTILLDRKIKGEEYTTFIGADNYEIGRSIGMYVSSLDLRRPVNVLEVWGVRGSSSAMERHQGFTEAMAIDPDVRLREVDGYWQESQAYERVMALDSLEDVDVVFAHNDMMALGVRRAIAKRAPALLNTIRFVGVDALPGEGLGVEAVAQGRLDASFYYPTGGSTAIEVASQILSGQPYSKKYALSTALVDRSNAGTLYLQSGRLTEYQRQIENQRSSLARLNDRFYSLYTSLIVTCVLLLLLGGSVMYMVYINRKIRQKHLLLKERNRQVQQQKEELAAAYLRIEQVTAQKLQFFTNVSHEVRTPLTLILAPLDRMAREVTSGVLADEIQVIRKNADRLKRVIDQLLDFRSIENNKMGMRVSETDLVAFVSDVCSCFDALARGKGIEYRFSHGSVPSRFWVDRDKLDKILTNLLSNAFKFTPVGGRVTVCLDEEQAGAVLSVEDTGEGIPPEQLEAVFDQFFTGGKDYTPGTGIGLHLTREFVLMHKGTIGVESEPHVRTTFTVRLPRGKEHFGENCVFLTNVPDLVTANLSDVDVSGIRETLRKRFEYTVLVVEDDLDIREYLRKELSVNFRVLTADNGVKALEVLPIEEVSLVISDVMMPEMSGFELCHRVKTNVAFNHIPVILLTALSEDNERLYGFDRGADEYIPKPFNIDVVRLRVIKLLEERDRLREAFRSEYQTPATSDPAHTGREAGSLDDLFMRKFLALLEANYADSDFSIERGSEKLGLSRVHLYRKVKELSGITPTDFLRDYRLKKASASLRKRTGSVSEVAYATGFSSPAYFSKCFKTVYGMTPSEYMDSL